MLPEAEGKSKPGWATASSNKKRDYWLNSVPTFNKFSPLKNDNTVKDNDTQIVDDNKVEDPATNSTNKPPPIFVCKVSNVNPLYSLLDTIAKDKYFLKVTGSNQLSKRGYGGEPSETFQCFGVH
ncbi:hypothetical protein TKK_0002353 [Trichogramma kaykai]